MAPLAIGLAVVVAHLVGVPITGTGLNPARSIGPAIVSGTWINHWIYWVGPIIGGMLAGLVYEAIFAQKKK